MRDVFSRLGAAGVALIVGALLFGALLGATAAHRADQIVTQNSAASQGEDKQDQQQGNAQAQQGENDKQDSESTKTKTEKPATTKKKPASDSD